MLTKYGRCAGRTAYRGVVQSKVPKGGWLALVGSGGGLGHLGIQFAKALGMKVIGIDARDEGLELSKSAGADLVVDARKGKDEVVKEVQQATDGVGCYATVNISEGRTAADIACAVTMMHGRMVQIAQVSHFQLLMWTALERAWLIWTSLMKYASRCRNSSSEI